MTRVPADHGCSDASDEFRSLNPATGEWIGPVFRAATTGAVRAACVRAEEAFAAKGAKTRELRAALLDTCAANIMALGDRLIAVAADETGLATARLSGERDRTVMQLRIFAGMVRDGRWVEAVIDPAAPLRAPMPKPDLRRMLRPLGPVAVFGASNFPLAYSVAGGDTASALAAGCPVVVKGHSAHPATGELVAGEVSRAVAACGFHVGTFSFLHAGGARDIAVGSELVVDPAIKAVGFTGSVAGGTAVVNLAGRRPVPIPVFAEMGSVNPVVVLPGALRVSGVSIAEKLAAAALNSGGQMCTCPGLVFVIGSGPESAQLEASLASAFVKASGITLLTPRTRDMLEKRRESVRATAGVVERVASVARDGCGAVMTGATLFVTSGTSFRANPTLNEECFGPSLILVRCENESDVRDCLGCITGSLTGTVFADESEAAAAASMIEAVQERVGRVIYNGVPTGVEVCAAMVHSGPFPACSRPESTAVGAYAIRRWCRPVCYQNVPDALLPPELRESNPQGIFRVVNAPA